MKGYLDLLDLLDCLDERERIIVSERLGLAGKEKSPEETAQLLGIAAHWVSRIEKRALTKLEKAGADLESLKLKARRATKGAEPTREKQMTVFTFEAESVGEISDGYHTFNELYHHRRMLFAVICKAHKDKAWKSRKHDDGTMYDNYFVAGIETPEGNYTYHFHKDHWKLFDVRAREFAPKYDGHTPKDITRLFSL